MHWPEAQQHCFACVCCICFACFVCFAMLALFACCAHFACCARFACSNCFPSRCLFCVLSCDHWRLSLYKWQYSSVEKIIPFLNTWLLSSPEYRMFKTTLWRQQNVLLFGMEYNTMTHPPLQYHWYSQYKRQCMYVKKMCVLAPRSPSGQNKS